MSSEFDRSLPTMPKKRIKASGIRIGYRAVSLLAVISLFFSLLSPLCFFSIWLVIFPLIGVICGLLALLAILSNPGDYTGRYFAISGILLSILFGIAGCGWGIWVFYFYVPEGYTVVDFMELRPDEKTGKLPDKFLQIGKEHRKIYIKGFMYPGRQLTGIQNFMLVRTVNHCKFCSPEQNPFDMISVHTTGELRVPFRTKAVFVGGELYVNENFSYGQLPYHIEADYFR